MTHLSDLQTTIAERLDAIRAEANTGMAALDARIRELSEAHDRLTRSVRLEDAARLIADDIRESVRKARAKLEKNAAYAAHLTAHAPVRKFGSQTADGALDASTTTPAPLRLLEHDTSPLEVIALLMTDDQVKGFAEAAAAAAGAKRGGRSVAELRAEADRTAAELEALFEERSKAKAALSGLIEVSLSPLVPDAFFNRPPEQVPYSPAQDAPKVRQFDADGNEVVRSFGMSYDELWAHRAAMDAAERNARSAAGDRPD